MPPAAVEVARPGPSVGARLAWAGALAALAAAVLVAADAHGHASRVPFEPPAELAARPWVAVPDDAAALAVWRAAELRGRHLVILTGQWARPRNLKAEPATPAELAAADATGALVPLDAASAIYTAATLGVARSIDVVLPPPAFARRLAVVAGAKELERGDGSFRLSASGFERRFFTPGSFAAPEEPVLVLVEPTWFGPGSPGDPIAWLAAAGVRYDLALLSLDDAAATAAERQAAAAFARASALPSVGAVP